MTRTPRTGSKILARSRDQRGTTTAEYAVVTAAGCGFAGVLIQLLTSDWGQKLLKALFEMIMHLIGVSF